VSGNPSQVIAVGDRAHIRHLSLEHATLTTIGCEAKEKREPSVRAFLLPYIIF